MRIDAFIVLMAVIAWGIFVGLHAQADWNFLINYQHASEREVWLTIIPANVVLWGVPSIVVLLAANLLVPKP